MKIFCEEPKNYLGRRLDSRGQGGRKEEARVCEERKEELEVVRIPITIATHNVPKLIR